MYITHMLPTIMDSVLTHGTVFGLVKSVPGLDLVIYSVAATLVASAAIVPSLSQLQNTANKIYSRMGFLGLNETELSERCSLAAVQTFADADVPGLTRDRVSKILMNRQDVPAKSAARIITHAELIIFAKVLKVSVEWLSGHGQSKDPVVWNVLANPDRVVEFEHLLQAYEGLGNETRVWSQYPRYSFTSEAFARAFNNVHFGGKPGIQNTRPLVEFYNGIARSRQKWHLRPDRSFKYTSLIYQSHFELAICGAGVFSAISKTILLRNLDVMIDRITDPSLRLELVILNDDYATDFDALRDYELLATVDNLFSVWGYHNAEVGWSEHLSYTNRHRQLLDRMIEHRLFRDVSETDEYLKSLRSRLRKGSKVDVK